MFSSAESGGTSFATKLVHGLGTAAVLAGTAYLFHRCFTRTTQSSAPPSTALIRYDPSILRGSSVPMTGTRDQPETLTLSYSLAGESQDPKEGPLKLDLIRSQATGGGSLSPDVEPYLRQIAKDHQSALMNVGEATTDGLRVMAKTIERRLNSSKPLGDYCQFEISFDDPGSERSKTA